MSESDADFVWKDKHFSGKIREWIDDPFEECVANRALENGRVRTVVIFSLYKDVGFCWVVEKKRFAVCSIHALGQGEFRELPPQKICSKIPRRPEGKG